METHVPLEILRQPDDLTCGPTCLHAVYRYYQDECDLHHLISEVEALDDGGTLAVFLACHALRRGYRATIYTYNLHIFDPSWFDDSAADVAHKLQAQAAVKPDPRLQIATRGYLEFLRLGGQVRHEDLTPRLIRRYLTRNCPILTGLSATFLYRERREIPETCRPDDVNGVPTGHFVVLCGYDKETHQVLVADPLHPNPLSHTHLYAVDMHRLVAAVLLGVITYDSILLMIEPRSPRARRPEERP